MGKGRAGPGGGVSQPPLSERPLAIPPRPAGCGPGCVTAAWSPRSWPGRNSKSTRAPSSRTCSASSSSVSTPAPHPAPHPPAGGSYPHLLSPTRGLGERGGGDPGLHCQGGHPHRNPQTDGAKPPLTPTGHLLLSHQAGASLPSQGLSSLLLRMRRVPQRAGFHAAC